MNLTPCGFARQSGAGPDGRANGGRGTPGASRRGGTIKADPRGALLLDRRQTCKLAGVQDYFHAAEEAFRAHGNGEALAQELMHLDAGAGEFHVKAGGLELGRPFLAFKINDGFYANARDHRLPNIRGTIVLREGGAESPPAILEPGEITHWRTAAAADLAASLFTRPDSRTITICGGGPQGQERLNAMSKTTIFDSTGTALQDVAAAAMIYQKALAPAASTFFQFWG